MNKIIVNNDKINVYDNDNYSVNQNKIIFKKSGNYFLEYVDCHSLDLVFEVNSDISVSLSELSFDNKINCNNKYVVGDKAFLIVNKFYNNIGVFENISVNLDGEGSRIDYNFSNICLGEEKYVIDINHNSKNTISNISNRSVSLNNSDLNFVINSHVPSEMIDSVLNQNTRIITFGDCNTKVSPNMFIDTDLVIANHGSVIGTIKEDVIFYLMSRGINYNDALKLVIKGYLFSNISADADIRSKIYKVMDTYWG